jgi:OOP family OmpA-OmpF porin
VENIANYAANQGVPASQLKESYHGQNKPVNTNDTDQGRADNRRVDIYMNK